MNRRSFITGVAGLLAGVACWLPSRREKPSGVVYGYTSGSVTVDAETVGFDVNELTPEQREAMQKELHAYANNLRRYLTLQGIT